MHPGAGRDFVAARTRCVPQRSEERTDTMHPGAGRKPSVPCKPMHPGNSSPYYSNYTCSVELANSKPLTPGLEVPQSFSVFHGSFAALVVGPSASFGGAGGGNLLNNVLYAAGRRLHPAGTGHIPDGAEAYLDLFGLFAVLQMVVVAQSQDGAIAAHDLALMAEVEAGHINALQGDVLPHVKLGPVGYGKYPEVLAHLFLAVEDVPQLGALVLRVPLAKAVSEAEKTFLGTGLLFITARAAHGRVELVFG